MKDPELKITTYKCPLFFITNLWFIENGRHNVHIPGLKSIANAFNMDVRDLL
jgi:hypothetical protein